MNLQIIRQLNEQHFREMEALELQYYGAEFITPAAEAWRWYRCHPHSTVAAALNGRLAGFVNLFPVQPTVYAALRAGKFNDHYMELADVADCSQLPLHMFLSCVLVEPEARALGGTRQLLRAAAMPYAGLPGCGIITDNVTEAGCRFSTRYGFRYVCHSDHESQVYEQSWAGFLANLGLQTLCDS